MLNFIPFPSNGAHWVVFLKDCVKKEGKMLQNNNLAGVFMQIFFFV